MGKWFTIEEMCHSTTAKAKGIDNKPTPYAVKNINLLIDNILDPLRERWGGPITVNSGYRCSALNIAVGGSYTSHHKKGMAADITVGSQLDNRRLFQLAMDMKLPFCQLIDERNFSWIHISYDKDDVRRQVLKL